MLNQNYKHFMYKQYIYVCYSLNLILYIYIYIYINKELDCLKKFLAPLCNITQGAIVCI